MSSENDIHMPNTVEEPSASLGKPDSCSTHNGSGTSFKENADSVSPVADKQKHGKFGGKVSKRGRQDFRKVRSETQNKRQKTERVKGNDQNDTTAANDVSDNNDDEQRRPKRKVACLIGYCGTGYHGMQINPPHKTIEGDIFTAFVQAGAVSKDNSQDPKKSSFMRAARTDKGVHAAGNVISLKMIIEDEDITEKINSFLPPTIRLWGITRTTKGFECRKHCDSRIYEYLIPSYSFLPPKPGSSLANLIVKADNEHPGIMLPDEDEEGAIFWSNVAEEVRNADIDEAKIQEAISSLPTEETESQRLPEEIFSQQKQLKSIENSHRRAYRISEKRLNRVRDALKLYQGAHNFHNFTIGKDYNDPSARRFMKSLVASDPKIINGMEWISIKIHGQSFMLHQIRKMIGLVALIIRSGTPLNRLTEVFQNVKVNIPKAPALGLLLERPVYDNFNVRLNKFGREAVDFSSYNDEIEKFKMQHIYDKIYNEEAQENTFFGFFGFLDNFKGDMSIFDYLTARGISADGHEKDEYVKKVRQEEMEELEDDNEG
ncbi:pseudouridine synthase [Dipodascopsis uninucleata]